MPLEAAAVFPRVPLEAAGGFPRCALEETGPRGLNTQEAAPRCPFFTEEGALPWVDDTQEAAPRCPFFHGGGLHLVALILGKRL